LEKSNDQKLKYQSLDIVSLIMTLLNIWFFIIILIIMTSTSAILNLLIVLPGYIILISYILYLMIKKNPFNRYPLTGLMLCLIFNTLFSFEKFGQNNFTIYTFFAILVIESIFLIDLFIKYNYTEDVARKRFYLRYGQRYGYGMDTIKQYWHNDKHKLQIKSNEVKLMKELAVKYKAKKISIISSIITVIEILLLLIFH